jgi:hypothetical protein
LVETKETKECLEEIYLSTMQIGRLQLFNEKETIHPTISTVETKETKFIRCLQKKIKKGKKQK